MYKARFKGGRWHTYHTLKKVTRPAEKENGRSRRFFYQAATNISKDPKNKDPKSFSEELKEISKHLTRF
ncbi:unnamed protein product [Amaranthus hypochondriacus]